MFLHHWLALSTLGAQSNVPGWASLGLSNFHLELLTAASPSLFLATSRRAHMVCSTTGWLQAAGQMAGTRTRYKGPPGKPKVTERWPRAGARIQTWWLSVQILGEKSRGNRWFEVGFNRWVGNLHKRWVRKFLSLPSIHTIPEGATSAV